MSNGMECGCTCSVDDYDLPSVFNLTAPRAKKRYKCCECNAEIQTGEMYQRVFGVWHGKATTFTTCLICARIRKHFCCGFGDLRERLLEALGMDYVTGTTVDDEAAGATNTDTEGEG